MANVHRVVPTYCALCISRCGCLATLEGDRLLRIDPDPLHPTGKSICIKARAAPELVMHPERLRTPLRRTRPKGDPDPGWQAISWGEALALAGERLAAAGPQATAFAVATPSGTAIADSFGWIHRLAHAWGSPNMIFATENCNWHRDFTPRLTWGNSLGMPDWENTATIVLWGCNPAATWLALAGRVRAAQQRGARLIVIDPRQAGLASGADLWLPVLPGTDAALALGLIHLLLTEGGVDVEFLRQHSDAFAPASDGSGTVLERLAAEVSAWTPTRVAEVSGVPEAKIRQAAEHFRTARPVSLYAWTGTCQQRQATDAARAINILYGLTGCLGRPGGNLWPAKPQVNDISGFERVREDRRRLSLGLAERPLGPPARGWVTSRDLFRTIVSEDPYPISALVAFGGNFLVSKPLTRHADEALSKLDFFVQTELFATPTARWADLLLPSASCWEREGLQAGFMVDAAAEMHLQLRPALVPPPGEARSDTRIVFDLADALGLNEQFFGGDPEAGMAYILEPSGVDPMVLRARSRGMTAPNLTRAAEPVRLHLSSTSLAQAGGNEFPCFTPSTVSHARPFVLTCGKTPHYCHSQFRQLASLRRRQPYPEAELAPDVAASRGIVDGAEIAIVTEHGQMHCHAVINPKLAPRVVWAHYGWWDVVAPINYNACSDGETFDLVSGSNALRGMACDVRCRPSM